MTVFGKETVTLFNLNSVPLGFCKQNSIFTHQLKGKVRKIENIGYMFEIRNYFAIIIDVETEIVQVLRKFS